MKVENIWGQEKTKYDNSDHPMKESHRYVISVGFSSLFAAQTRNSEFDQKNEHERIWKQLWKKIIRIDRGQ